MAVLRATRGVNPGQMFTLERKSAVLGRHPECDMVLEAPAVSRQHAQIRYHEGHYYLEDLGSRNGTYLNGKLLTQPQRLQDNDEIQVCDLAFVFHLDQPRPADLEPKTAVMVDDEATQGGSTIMSKLDVSSGSSGLQLQANAEAKLKALVAIGQGLGKAVGLGAVLDGLLDSLFAIFVQADRGFVVLKDPRTGRLIPKAVKHRRLDDLQTVRISRTIVNGVIGTKEAILSADAATDARFEMADSIVDFHIRSMMCAPLVGSDGQAMGVIQVDTLDQRNRFNGDDLDVLVAVACQAAFAVENAQLHESALRERAIERDLALAHQVQQGFLPAGAPQLAGYEFFEFYEPANKLGGDYFDYIPLSAGRLAVVVADVSGKGIAASLLMARLSAETRYCLVSEPTPAEAVARLNRVFSDASWEDRFVTLVLTVLDPLRHELTLVNAGHLPPLLRRGNGEVAALAEDETRLPLGVDAQGTYPQISVPLGPGDNLVLYTDGITEAMNDKGALYGRPRLWAQLDSPIPNVRTLGLRILEDVKRFVGSRAQSDDMCLTCFGRTEG